MDVRCVRDVSMEVKSDFSSVMPVPSMTPASMIDIQLPLFTQFNVLGAYDPSIAEPNTKNGNKDVSLDRIRSSFGIVVVIEDDGMEPSSEVDDANITLISFLFCLHLYAADRFAL